MRRALSLLLLMMTVAATLPAQNLKLEKTLPFSDETAIRFTAISPKGNFLATASKDARVRLWTYPALELRKTFDLTDERIAGVWFSHDGAFLIAGGSRGKIRIWSLPSGAQKMEFSAGDDINALAISYDLSMMAVAAGDKPAQLWDLRLGRRVGELPTKFSGSKALCFSPDGKWLASADADTGVRFYEGETGAPRATNDDLLLESFGAAFSSDGKYLYVGGADKTITAIDPATGKIVDKFPKQDYVVGILDPSPDGKTLAAGYFDEKGFDNPAPIILWDLASKKPRTTIMQQDFHPNGGGFLPDGRLLITSSEKGKLQVWVVM
jgi:WD40 repeat protein